jgi:hypothetical protein
LIRAWIHILALIKKRNDEKVASKTQFPEMSNLNNLFIKNPAWSLNDVDYKELTSTKDMSNAYNIFMMSQLFFLWGEKKVFGKKLAKNKEEC